jgi:hypothetical protein
MSSDEEQSQQTVPSHVTTESTPPAREPAEHTG